MTINMNARWAGRVTLALGIALLVIGATRWTALARADEPAKELTEEERGKLAKEAAKFYQQVDQLYQDGNNAAATALQEKSLKMARRLYPAEKYPDGHPNLATIINNLGLLLKERGEYGKAEPLYRDSLEMRRRLYPNR
jgi:tetratricopeptide (TPR) repeat protein